MLLMGQLTISMAIFNEAGGGVPRTTCLGAGGWSGLGEGEEVALFLLVKCQEPNLGWSINVSTLW